MVPAPQTLHKVQRPKQVNFDRSVVTGALAWYPCVKEKFEGSNLIVRPRLAYCWESYLAVLTIHNKEDLQRTDLLEFGITYEWNYSEALVSLQWLSRQVSSFYLTLFKNLMG